MVLQIEPSGPTDRSEVGLLGCVLRARSQQWSCGPSLGPEVHIDPAHLAFAHLHKAQAGAVVGPGPAAPNASSDLVGDGPGGRLGEDTGLGDPCLGTIADRVDAREGRGEGERVHLYPPVLSEPGLHQHIWHLVHRDADEQVIRLVMVLEMRNLVGGIDAVDATMLGVLDAPRRHRSLYRLRGLR